MELCTLKHISAPLNTSVLLTHVSTPLNTSVLLTP